MRGGVALDLSPYLFYVPRTTIFLNCVSTRFIEKRKSVKPSFRMRPVFLKDARYLMMMMMTMIIPMEITMIVIMIVIKMIMMMTMKMITVMIMT